MTDTIIEISTITLYDLLDAAECAAVERAIAESTRILPEAPQRLQAKARALGFTLNRRVQPTRPPHGKRSLSDAASVIRSCIQRIHEAKGECPMQADYQAALTAEHETYLQWQYMKASKRPDPDGTWSMQTIRQKHAYQTAKEQRIQIDGQIHGTRSIVRRMNALIAGEVLHVKA
jgi:hypothetical protein